MCGIAGILHFDPDKVADRSVIEAMTKAMVHRGPDDEGYYVDRHVGLGHRRLSIIDRATGKQPMSNEDDTAWIIFNGEIYNYLELREDLIAQGHLFKTRSDTEVILHLYEDLEEGCLDRLHGMFAFAIWDKRKGQLLVARDRLGIKPLYYVQGCDYLAFCSEIKGLLRLKFIQPEVNLQALHDYLTFGYTIAPQTIFDRILKLEPGCFLKVQGCRVTQARYWDLNFSKKLAMTEAEMVKEFQARIRASTRSHLIGEVPIGVLLSGGLDSTVVTELVSEVAGGRVKTFSVGFAGEEGTELDERPYARLASRYFDTDHHELTITSRQYADTLRDYVWYMEEPLADPTAIPLYCISKLARDYVTVILSGEGSDELLAGYTFWMPYKGFHRARWFRKVPALIRNKLVTPVNHRFFKSSRLARYLTLSNAPISDYLLFLPAYMDNVFSEDAKRELYSQEVRGQTSFRRSIDVVIDAYRKTTDFDFLDQMLYVYTKQWLPDHTLIKSDKMTMAHSLELRVPFLDHTFVEFAAGLPVEMKMRRNGRGTYATKIILRKAFEGKVPPQILNRKKLGFPVPLERIFQEELGTRARDLFSSQSFRQGGFFNHKTIDVLLREHEAGIDRKHQIWSLLVWALWYDAFKGVQELRVS